MKRESFLLLSVLFVPVLSQGSVSKPDKVQGVTVTRTVQGSSPALRVSWSAVSRSGITYTVCYSTNRGSQSDPPSGANCDTSGITSTSTTLGPLSGGTAYYIWVRAVSSGGQGPYSGRVQRRACIVPSRPKILLLGATTHARLGFGLFVSWEVPQSDCSITTYKVQHKISSNTSWSTPPVSVLPPLRNHNWRGLSPNTSYDVRVRAISEAGEGEWSDVGEATTYAAPGPVQSLAATPIAVNGEPVLYVRWSYPVGRAQGGLTYRLRVDPPHVTISRPVTAAEYNVTGLRANTKYTVYVRTVFSGVVGPEVSTVATTVGRPPSFTVTQLTGQRLSTSSVTLRIPPSVGSRYVVFYKEDGQQFTKHPTTFSSANNVVITGLQSNTRYTMRVQASNDYGSTNSSDVDVYTLPEGLRDLFLSPLSSTSLLCSWTPPVNHRKTPLMYAVSHGQPGAVSTAETSLTLTGLQPYKEYTISVKAQNRRGSSVPVTGTVRTYSDNQTKMADGIIVKRTSGSSVLVTWIPMRMSSDKSRGSPLYIVTYMSSDGGRTGSINTTSNSVTLTGLDSGVSYVISVQVTIGILMNKGNITPAMKYPVCQPQADNTGLIVGVLIGGMAIGAVTVLLVVGIVCGVCKLRQHPKQPTSEEPDNKVEAIYEKVDEATCSNVTMTISPAYERVKIE